MAEEKDINLADLIGRMWKHRKLFIIVCGACAAFAVFLAIFSPRTFKSECVFVPQTNQSFTSRYSSIASMIGMDLDMGGNDGPISPRVYPYILENPNYLRDLMYTKVHIEGFAEPVSIYDFYTDEQYHKFNLITSIKKYTIGLPGLLLSKMLPDKKHDKDVETFNAFKTDSIPALTDAEDAVARILSKSVTLDVDAKQGILTIDAYMPEALASAELCQSAYELIKQYVSDFKLTKSKHNLEFIEKQYADAKEDYFRKQRAFAYYMDSNKGVMTAAAQVERIRLENEAQLAQSLYSELAKNVLSSRVKLEENNVSFTEIAPIGVPNRKFKPSGMLLLIVWLFLGFTGTCCYLGIKSIKNNRKEEEAA